MATSERPSGAPRRKTDRTTRIRTRILSEWRGCDEALDLQSRVNRAGAFIDAVLKTAGLAEGIQEQELKTAWREIAGEFIARNTEPASVKNGVLVLHVTQPAMRFQLEQMKPMLLGRIRENQGTARIKSIKFTIG
jgi:predicted nucleic acid-binding Zn ribbon protein